MRKHFKGEQNAPIACALRLVLIYLFFSGRDFFIYIGELYFKNELIGIFIFPPWVSRNKLKTQLRSWWYFSLGFIIMMDSIHIVYSHLIHC